MSRIAHALDYLAVLQFHGEDTLGFLQAQLTADLRKLEAENPRFACVCNPKGRVMGLLLLARTEPETVLAVCAAELAAPLEAHLSRYVFRSRVRIGRRDDLVVCAVPEDTGGDRTGPLIAHFAGCYALQPRDNGEVSAPGWQQADSPVEWQAGEMERGVHWLNAATSGAFLPQMLGLQSIEAISFNKGCYPGQEVIARTRHLGRLKRHPLLCSVQGEVRAKAMDEVLLQRGSDEVSAVVVNAVHRSDGSTLVMLVARCPEAYRPQRLVCAETAFPVSWSTVPGAMQTG